MGIETGLSHWAGILPRTMRFLALLLCPVTLLVAGDFRRDWKAFPAAVQAETSADLFAVGDVHGDRERLLKVLAGAKVVRAEGEHTVWTAGSAILIFTGDMIDKGPDALGAIALIRSLQ